MTHEEIMDEVRKYIFGTPKRRNELAAALWTAYLRSTPCGKDTAFEFCAKDVEVMLSLVDVARVSTKKCGNCEQWKNDECCQFWGMDKNDSCPDYSEKKYV